MPVSQSHAWADIEDDGDLSVPPSQRLARECHGAGVTAAPPTASVTTRTDTAEVTAPPTAAPGSHIGTPATTLQMLVEAVNSTAAYADASAECELAANAAHIAADASDGAATCASSAQAAQGVAARVLKAAMLSQVHTVLCVLTGCLLMHSSDAEKALGSKLTLLHLKSSVRAAVARQAGLDEHTDGQRALLRWATQLSGPNGVLSESLEVRYTDLVVHRTAMQLR